jgi:hypothetical protein
MLTTRRGISSEGHQASIEAVTREQKTTPQREDAENAEITRRNNKSKLERAEGAEKRVGKGAAG